MKNNRRFSALRLTLLPAAAAVLMACASTPATNAALSEAQALYRQAAGNPDVARSAPLELRAAQAALTQAEAALAAGEDKTAVDHFAYLARQRAATAIKAGDIARAEQAVTLAGRDRERIVMAARSSEAAAGTAAALQARAQTEQALTEADRQQAAAEAARARAARLQQELTELQAKQTERGMVLTLGDVLFDTGRAELKPGAFSTVDRLANFLRQNPERTVAIEGHTDSVGDDNFNQSLSQRRAEAVRAALNRSGIDGARVTAAGMGESSPVANNATAEGRQLNRRVEVVISNPN